MQFFRRLRPHIGAIAATVLGVLWLAVFPLLGVIWMNGAPFSIPMSFGNITQSKYELMVLLTLVSLLAAPLMLWDGLKKLDPKHLTRWLLALFLLLVCFSAMYGAMADAVNANHQLVTLYGYRRYEGLITQLCYVAIALLLSLHPPRMKVVVGAAAVALLLMLGVVAMQYAGGNPLGLYPKLLNKATNTEIQLSIYTSYEFQGTLGNIDMIAGYTALMMPLLLGSWVVWGGTMGALLLPAGLGAVLLTLYMDVQSGLLSLAAFVGLLVLAFLRTADLPMRRRMLLALAGILICVTLRQLTGLPWIDGLSQPWNLPMRSDAPLPKLTGGEAVIFPWLPTAKKLLPTGIAIVIAALAYLPGKRVHRWLGSGKVRWRYILAALLLLAAAAVLVIYYTTPTHSALFELHEVLHGRAQDSFGSERLGVWRHTLHIAAEHPLLGIGPDTFYPAMKQHLVQCGAQLTQNFDTPHNIYLSILCQNGAPALALFIAAMAVLLIKGSRRRACLPLTGAVACYLVQGLFLFFMCIVTPMFWAVAGIAMAMIDAVPPSSTQPQGFVL